MPRRFKVGDWICGQCDDHQFARNMFCRICGAPTSHEIPWTPRDDALQLPHIQAVKLEKKKAEKAKHKMRKEKKLAQALEK